jgi:rfaE bifunctional protein kinase chain/domain/rfaE bifunctional protein nucleotidyltransferase chain/domain
MGSMEIMENKLTNSKIIDYREIEAYINQIRANKKIVLCHGVFDLMHIGHIRHFKSAKKLGDMLIVSLTPDQYVNKGPGRPAFPDYLRAEAIESLSDVDLVVINNTPTAESMINRVKPDLYVKGSEYQDASKDITGKISDEVHAVRAWGGDVAFTSDITFSSSSLINQYFPCYQDEVTEYLHKFRKRYKSQDVLDLLQKSSDLKVAVIGETIIDEYVFSETLGKAGKEPVLVAKKMQVKRYAGGILAIANHVASFAKEVDCFTVLGQNLEHMDFIDSKISDNVKLHATPKSDSPTIVKRRFVDKHLNQKLFETYEINDDAITGDSKSQFNKLLHEKLPQYDLVIVADYGHGLLNEDEVAVISKQSKFLSVNVQANAGNHGYNSILKYPKASYVCIAQREVDLVFRKHLEDPIEQIHLLTQKFDYQNVLVTASQRGCAIYKANEEIVNIPAFANKVTDRIGAGDAVLAITSLCMVLNIPAEIVGFVGNVVGAEAVAIMCNERAIDKVSLYKHITHLLK